MKKAISLFLAMSVLCFATSAMAATMESVDGNRNSGDVTEFNTTYNGTGGRDIPMPAFRPGDTLTFDLSALTTDKELTVASYKYGGWVDEGGVRYFEDAYVQYIDQYTIDDDDMEISYKIRDMKSGIYVLRINDSVAPVATFYYKVGNPTTDTVHSEELAPDNATAYRMVDFGGDNGWSIGFIGKITMDSADVKFGEIAAKPGFKFNGGKFTNYVTNGIDGDTLDEYMEDLATANGIEIRGTYSVIYGMTLYNVSNSHKSSITATAVVDAN